MRKSILKILSFLAAGIRQRRKNSQAAAHCCSCREQQQKPGSRPGATMAAAQNCEPMFDAWMKCLVNSECFKSHESSKGDRAALKICANPQKMSDVCKLAHQEFQACKRGVFQAALEKPPAFLAGSPDTTAAVQVGADRTPTSSGPQ